MTKKIIFVFISTSIFVTSFGQPMKGVDYLGILKRAATYNIKEKVNFPKFTYESSIDSALVSLRKKFNLDSVSGFGNQESRILNIRH